MTHHHNLKTALSKVCQEAIAIETWLRERITDLPTLAYFKISISDSMYSWKIDLCQGYDRHELAADSLIEHIQKEGEISFDELRDFQV